MTTVLEMAPVHGILATCAAFGIAVATYYRKRSPMHGPRPARPSPARRLPDAERTLVLEALHQPRFVDLAPAEVFAMLLQEGRYLCSVRTMHRILGENQELRERRNQLRHPAYTKPELMATAPNQHILMSAGHGTVHSASMAVDVSLAAPSAAGAVPETAAVMSCASTGSRSASSEGNSVRSCVVSMTPLVASRRST